VLKINKNMRICMEENLSDKPIEYKVVEALKKRKLVVSTAESCTGGLLASHIVNVAGASAVFHQGYITYCDDAKIQMLGVSKETLHTYYAVSSQTAIEMAKGCARISGADIGLSVTGVAGPDMEDGKPVGLVYIGCCYRDECKAYEFHFSGNRTDVRNQAVYEALCIILNTLDTIYNGYK